MVNPGARVMNVSSADDVLVVEIEDGRAISVPLTCWPRLLHASQKERDHWQVAGGGFGVHRPIIDEDLSVDGLLRGAPAPRVRVMRANTAMHLTCYRRFTSPFEFRGKLIRRATALHLSG